MLLDEAVIFDYNDKKIWAKHVNETLYIINGQYFAFNEIDRDLITAKPERLAYILDLFYSPFDYPAYPEEHEILSISRGSNGERSVNSFYLRNCMFDITDAPRIMSEYKAWAETVGESNIYVDDRHDMDRNAWLMWDISPERKKVKAGWMYEA